MDGGAFYSYEKIGQQDFPVFAPLAIYGEYYFREEDAVNKTSVPIQPSFYCNPRTKRRLPVPFPDRSEEFSVHLPERGHQLEVMDEELGKKRLVVSEWQIMYDRMFVSLAEPAVFFYFRWEEREGEKNMSGHSSQLSVDIRTNS